MCWFSRTTCAGSHGGHALTEDMCWFRRRISQGGHVVVPTEDMCWQMVQDGMGWNFGRTDLRISRSKAKFDARADGDVRLAVRRPKPHKNSEKPNFFPKISPKNFFWRRKIFCWESSETRFGKFSCRSEPSSRRKRPSKVRISLTRSVSTRTK